MPHAPDAHRPTAALARAAVAARVDSLSWRMSIAPPAVTFRVRGKVSGRAHCPSTRDACGRVDFNLDLLLANYETFLATTVPHEVAHIVVWTRYGRAARPHGREWKETMRALGAEPNRTHSYDTTEVAVRAGRSVACECSKCGESIALGVVRARRIARSESAYTHRACGGRIVLAGGAA